MDNTREKIYLAALLHDIGKFYQRASKPFSEEQSGLSEMSKRIAGYICPLNENNNFGYQHTIWTHEFLQEKDSVFKKVPELAGNVYNTDNEDSIFQMACFHHKPGTELQALISLADWWSAGIDRRTNRLEEEYGEKNGINWGMQRYKKIPLYSVFNKIHQGNYQFAFGLNKLSIDEKGFYPCDIKKLEDGNTTDKYKMLWDEFVGEFEQLPTDSFEGFTESLLFLLKKYTWCIPSNTTDMANVSLFDHLKTTAAFADCLYVYWKEHHDEFVYDKIRLTVKEGVKPVILLGGDLSGIQKFIYNIASRKAAVSLKGRSFYLQLLIDSIIQRIISHPDIKASLSHVVYSSGGKFYMVLPNTTKVLAAIQSIKTDLEKSLWEEHHGQLVVNIDYVSFAYNLKGKGLDFENRENQPIGELWRTLAEKLTCQKNLKFKNLLMDSYGEFFEVQEVGEKSKVCAVTGVENENLVAIDSDETGDKTLVLPIVKKQAELGNVLKDVDYVITYRGNDSNDYLNSYAKFKISCVGIDNYLFDQKELIDNEADFRTITSADVCRVKRVNNTGFIIKLKGNKCGYGFQFYGGNKQAQIVDEETKRLRNETFEELADKTYLGILRMDVDNLGSIFINGLPDEDKSFAAYSTLSFMLDYFFSGFLNTIRERDNFKEDVNILYSGGDDVFAVGRWDKLIEFAEAIREDFRKFVGRDDISISGGIAVVGESFPIAKAADMAGDAEDAAKKHNNAAKNAFNLFGESVSWNESEYGYVKSYKQKFVSLINDFGLSRGILHKIMTYASIVEENQIIAEGNSNGIHKRKPNMSYLWHTAYYLTRYMETNKSKVEVVAFCKDLRDKQLLNAEKYRLMALAARWVELELRMNNTEKDEN